MTHPGLAVMLMVGVGLGAVLYYFFASTTEPTGAQANRRPRDTSRSQGASNGSCWSSSPSSDPRNRRQDQKCTICLDESNEMDKVRLVGCKHVFHKQCILKWRVSGSGEASQCCPICREKIRDIEEL